ncbi:uncharacterized protein LOC129355353 [Poeciliopsis prolifica]|uniref:uncharacterized protein LOC129355353 n=1 Tax=Poeciliopsis prolifica TaxID=188132 RepID=UPI002413D08C|nr:uncharacterized protein LOC129355353 [Poeciliopsis prolifica]
MPTITIKDSTAFQVLYFLLSSSQLVLLPPTFFNGLQTSLEGLMDTPFQGFPRHRWRGTGWRHAVRPWTATEVTNHCHKLVIPEGLPDKKPLAEGIPYYPLADYFSLNSLNLWCRDGIHLSDNHGMQILKELIWVFSYQFMESSAPKPLVQSQRTPPYQPRFVPRVVVKGEEHSRPASPLPTEWMLVRSGRKRNYSGESDDSPKERVVHCQRDHTPQRVAAVTQCAIPSNPVRFSPAILVAMETVSPSALSDVRTGTETKPVEHTKKPPVSKLRLVRQKVVLK